MNIPNSDKAKSDIPEEAKGNPVYEQTRQDMPLWCCGRNCARNTRLVCLVLVLIGIACSIWACLSPRYFSFVAVRNDTFYDPAKAQPEPFEYATEANVGLFKYQILDVFVYPWPPNKERALFDEMLLDELRRMQEDTNATGTEDPLSEGNSTDAPLAGIDENTTAVPTTSPTTLLARDNCTDIVKPGPGSVACGVTASPTSAPSTAPTITNPNIIVEETVDIGVVKTYLEGVGQFDSTFTNGQRGAIMGPVFAFLGTIFSLIEMCCCTYKCSWLPTAIFLYLAFMFQLFTLFLFLSEDWCKYDQDCALGGAGFASVIAVICYMIAQNLICCSPRPAPYFNLCKKKTVTKKKKKKKPGDDENDEREGLTRDFDDPDYDDPDYDDQRDSFRDEPDHARYDDQYDDGNEDEYDYGEDSYRDPAMENNHPSNRSMQEDDLYSSEYDNDTYDEGDYDDDTYNDRSYNDDDGDTSYYTEDDGTDYDSNKNSRSGY